MLKDHKVIAREAWQIKAVAEAVRNKLYGDRLGHIRAADSILTFTRELKVNNEFVKLEFRSASKIGAPAVVSYRPLKLEFDRIAWTRALLANDLETNYIAAHELGHIMLHNHDAQPYSGAKREWIDFEEQSAEWQANKFADYFLVSDRDVEYYISPDVISRVCQVPLSVAERRFLEIAKYAVCSCQECFGTKVYRIRLDHFCWSCRTAFM